MTPDLDHRRRTAGADPQDKAARLAHARELARAGRGDDLLAPLATLDAWSGLDPHHQDLLIAEVARRLDDRWECLGAREWSCPVNGEPHAQRLGLFRHTEMGAEFSLIPGGAAIEGLLKVKDKSGCDDTVIRLAPMVSPLLVGRWPVTTCQAHGCIAGAQSQRHEHGMPLTGYTQAEARLLLATFGLRLPRMAEWKWAASGGSGALFPWGDEMDFSYFWCLDNSNEHGEGPQADGYSDECSGCEASRHSPDEHDDSGKANAYGLVDCHGNVWEWCEGENELSLASSGLLLGGSFASPRQAFEHDGVAHHGIWTRLGGEYLVDVGLRAFADIPGWRSP